ncbi:MAG: ABC transporter permease [Candidatus Latescibacterota bacterium]|nr:ABC transporter permease [Candidatus Latescibacterota bacterium]
MLARIAFRNVFRQRRRSLFTSLMMVGGFTLSSLSIGISDGSYAHLIDMFTRDQTGHLQIHRQGYRQQPSLHATLTADERLVRAIEHQSGFAAWAPRVYAPGLAFLGRKTAGARLVGVDPVREPATTRLKQKISEGRFFAADEGNSIILTCTLAEVLDADIGDEIALIGQGADGSIANDLFSIVGIVGASGRTRVGRTYYLPLDAARRFLSLPRAHVHEIAVVLEDHRDADAAADEIAQRIGAADNLEVAPWRMVEWEFYRAMKVDQEGMWVSLLIIVIIVAIGVLNTVLMSVLERTREFGVLRAMGTPPRALFSMIVLETTFLTLLSLIPAVSLSVILNFWLSQQGISIPNPINYGGVLFSHIYSEVNARVLWLPGLVVLLASVGVSLFPAWRTARIAPADAMRAH